LIPLREALFSVATPLEFVVALPTPTPFNVKLIVSPFTGELPDVVVKVAESVVVPPYVPLAAATDKLVAGLLTVNPPLRVAVPPTGAGLVTETLCAPIEAVDGIVMFAISWVWLFTVIVFTVMSDPRLAVVTLPKKPLPVRTTFNVVCRFPLVGLILVSVGAG
jgi:hypothetical protein